MVHANISNDVAARTHCFERQREVRALASLCNRLWLIPLLLRLIALFSTKYVNIALQITHVKSGLDINCFALKVFQSY